ncbi:hypothetical protein BV898_00417 [Hypsibius exemplaris]|uniref:Uncharacterized protein n=1 Tax=Hypsibius exemplaris TaxID=2072580 RepID=A0A1W0XDB0_HYPEX|nr:hypothetical protein BV898_00417 [Hypsibius exemplaris]
MTGRFAQSRLWRSLLLGHVQECFDPQNRSTSETMLPFTHSSLFGILVTFFWVFPFCAAFDAGDAIALTLGLILTGMAVFACLGVYARRVAANAHTYYTPAEG